ncbi:MAG: aminopeptidase N [Desulfobulbaceae bacterium S3730MH12]|nr:MAG: aminopeptidase N [Desulfobulbaceae bacterium S3730MH12]
MAKEKSTTIFRKDYSAPHYFIESVELLFQLFNEKTRVTAKSNFSLNEQGGLTNAPLILSGEDLHLISVKLDGQLISADKYSVDNKTLTIANPPPTFTLEIVTEIDPSQNTSLEGLYRSSGNYCTQCEAEGFRKITYYLDRPDILAKFVVRIEADKESCPVMLSNGNCIDKGELEANRHYAIWQDPFPKPCYLFALVAGKLVCLEEKFITRSGKSIDLKIYVEEKNRLKCGHAMLSLKKAMKWDEDVFGLEYDLDIYMIVAVDDFNMGAMENKGLNIFNSKYVLSTPETATDEDYIGIEGVIAHEYFHNWTGNRVTCRDWFQLSLKEGLTVFRDQEFSSDMNSRTVQRIQNVRILKNFQFREDSGPMAHPVRPESYQEINNFYTVTVYNKGAEVIRMMHTILGADAFRRGMDLYFERHDGEAATCDDFVAAMSDSSGEDLDQFKNWYSQSGTPVLQVEGVWNETRDEYKLTISQHCPETPGQNEKESFHLPVTVGLMNREGKNLITAESGTTKILQFKEKKQTFTFSDIHEQPVVSFLRDFSAPVKVEPFHSQKELALLMKHDSNMFNRWNAATELAASTILDIVEMIHQGDKPEYNELFFSGVAHSLTTPVDDPSLLALALQLPAETTLVQEMSTVDPDALHNSRQAVKQELATRYQSELSHLYHNNKTGGDYQITSREIGKRSLKNTALSYLMSLDPLPSDILQLCVDQYRQATNMTDTIASLQCIVNLESSIRTELFEDFYERWQRDTLVMDKWFTLQATSFLPNTLENVKHLTRNELFSIENPNKVRSLIGAFCSANHVRFHDNSGEGYSFLGDMIIKLNTLNPQIAARLITPLINWKRYDKGRQALMREQLDRIAGQKGLSRGVAEIVNKSR